jgi:hypothetical protein
VNRYCNIKTKIQYELKINTEYDCVARGKGKGKGPDLYFLTNVTDTDVVFIVTRVQIKKRSSKQNGKLKELQELFTRDDPALMHSVFRVHRPSKDLLHFCC